MKTNDIRKLWLDFFAEKGHYIEPSHSLIPFDDDSLLFINSGVSTLKKYFDGSEKPNSPKLANAQKSLRTNDIENVGVTSRHHTLFEMLGNFSIGDYFKEEAIDLAYELLTSEKWFNIDVNKLYFTVHPDDNVAYQKWLNLGIAKEKIVKLEENFWEIGEGPGGPNTEIFYDRGEEYDTRDVIKLLAEDLENDRIIEIWNIVFSQYNCMPGKLERSHYSELPQKNIDTGMGLERMACIMQDVPTNFETDNFIVIINALQKLTDVKYADNQKPFRIIADHIRALVFATSDGALPASEGRGYVLRRLLRRAVKFAYLELGITKPFLEQLINIVIDINIDFYPYLKENEQYVKKVINKEEKKFLETIAEGIELCFKIIEEEGKITGDNAFKLYDTYGFPIEITEEIAIDNKVSIDLERFTKCMEEQKTRARENAKGGAGMNMQSELLQNLDAESKFIGYERLAILATINCIIEDDNLVTKSSSNVVNVILDQTPFYAESGGQISDKGYIGNNKVIEVSKLANGQHIHTIEITTPITVGEKILAQVNSEFRANITKNHSVTHLLHLALRNELGNTVTQQGSYQDDRKTRFDYSTLEALSEEQLLTIQNEVNDNIQNNYEVEIKEMPIDEAKSKGAVALFGEKYGDIVRVVEMGPSIELCGGTHVKNTSEIKHFYISHESGIGSGTRRIEAITGEQVKVHEIQLIDEIEKMIRALSTKVNSGEVIKTKNVEELIAKLPRLSQVTKNNYDIFFQAIEQLNLKSDSNKKALAAKNEQQGASLKKQIVNSATLTGDVSKIDYTIKDSEVTINDLRSLSDQLINENENLLLVLRLVNGNKLSVIVKCSKNITNTYKANEIIKQILSQYGGKGGGNAEMAQGGATLNG